MQCACALLSSVACPALTIFFQIFFINGTIFEKKLLNKKCVFWFSLQRLFETFLILRRNEWDMIKMCIGLHVKYPIFLSDFTETWIFPDRFSKNSQISNFMKIRPVRSELFNAGGRTDRQTDTTKLKVAFRNFANVPKKNYTFFPHSAFLCFVWISEETALISKSRVTWRVYNWYGVHCAVGTGSLNRILLFVLNGLVLYKCKANSFISTKKCPFLCRKFPVIKTN